MFTKLLQTLEAFKNTFNNFTVSLFPVTPEIKANVMYITLGRYEADKKTWGANTKKGIVSVIFSKSINDLGNLDSITQAVYEKINELYDIIEATEIDFQYLSAQKLIYVYMGFQVVWA